MLRGALLAFVLGVWGLQQQAVLPDLIWVWLVFPVACCVWWQRGKRYAHLSLIPLAVAAGFYWAAWIAQQWLADSLPLAWEGREVEVIGVVAELPKYQERGERFVFDVESTLTPGARIPRRVSLMSYRAGLGNQNEGVQPGVGAFHAGERWRLTVRLKRPHGSYNPYGFDFEAWALERDIRATGYVKSGAASQRLQARVLRPGYLVEVAREHIRAHFRAVLGDRPYAPVLLALAIGDDSAIRRDDWQMFLRTGINHLMSISGLHVTMVSGLAYALALALWRRSQRLVQRLPARKAAAAAGLATALAYALLAGFAVPAQRTVYMLAVVAAALWSGRTASISLVLCWALVVVCLLDPWAVLSPGFWLSFGAVAVMVYAGGNRLARPHWLRESVNTQWAVTLGLAPLLLVLFQQVSLISPVANAVAIPVVSFVVVPLTLLGALIPVDAILLAAHQIMAWLMQLLAWCAGWPEAVWQQHAPPLWTLAPAVLGMAWMLLPRGFPARWLGALPCLPMLLWAPSPPALGELSVAVLDVGQGLSVVARTASHALLFDAGSRSSRDADSGSFVIVPYLRGTGIRRLDGMIVSHDDIDHSGGARSVLEAVPTGWLASSLPAGHPLLQASQRPLRCFGGQRWVWDGVAFEILHPDWASYAQADISDNQRSCVLKITSPHGSILIPADIERESEMRLVDGAPEKLSADVLIAPHHGSKTSSSEAFLQAVSPGLSIFTVGYRNHFGHPKPEIVARYTALGGRLLRSDADGAVLIGFAPGGILVQSWRSARPRYWLAESTDAR